MRASGGATFSRTADWCGSLLYGFTADAIYFDNEGNPAPWSPNRYKIGDLLEALSSLVILPDDFEQPCWIDGRQTGPIVATSNGLYRVPEIVTLDRLPGEGESDSRWRTREVRHVGPDTLTPGF